jgi:hypothetical protein
MKTFIVTIFLIQLCAFGIYAQQYQFELNVKATAFGAEEYPTGNVDPDIITPAFGFSGEVLYFPLNNVGIGAYYSKSVLAGEKYFYENNDYTYSGETKYDYATYGLSLQLTTNRKRGFRLYAVGRVGLVEILDDFDGFKMGNSGLGYGGGIGTMLKFSRRISWNIFEANYMALPKEFSVDNKTTTFALAVQSGFSYKFIRKK